MAHYDVIVIGGGTMGTAAAWELGKRGLKALVLEQFQHIHPFGAHSGETRVIRHAYAEGAGYVPLVQRADDLWVDLEHQIGRQILHRVGVLEMSGPDAKHAERARDAAAVHGISFDWLTPTQVRARFPQFLIGDDWSAGYGPGAGFLDVVAGLRGMASLARARGVEIREQTPVLEWSVDGNLARVSVDGSIETADRLIITAGAWSSRLLAGLGIPLTVRRKTLFWLEVVQPDRLLPVHTPVYLADVPGCEFYGFPVFGRQGIKVAIHNGGAETEPGAVDREITASEKAEIVQVARNVVRGVKGNVLDACVCLYTVTPDQHFVIDRVPGQDRVVFGAGFSGHGFKFAPAIGELLVQMALGERETPPLFALDRFQVDSQVQ